MAFAWGSAQCASTTSLVSGCIGVSPVSFGEALAAYGDGSLALFSTNDKQAGLVELPLHGTFKGPSLGVHHFAACTGTGEVFFVMASGLGGDLTVGHARRGGGAAGTAGLAECASRMHHAGAGATCAHLSAGPPEFVVYGTADGWVRRQSLREGRAAAGAALPAKSTAEGCGPCCHAVLCTPDPFVVMAACGPALHLFDFRDSSPGRQIFAGGGGAITCATLGDDSQLLFGGTERGSVSCWDQRKPSAWDRGASVLQHEWHREALHAGPVWALSASAETGVLFTAGDDGCVRRLGLQDEGGEEAALELRAEAPLRALAWLTSHRQRQAGSGEGLLAAAAESGGVEWAVVALEEPE